MQHADHYLIYPIDNENSAWNDLYNIEQRMDYITATFHLGLAGHKYYFLAEYRYIRALYSLIRAYMR